MATKTYNARTLLVPAKPRNKRLREIGDHGGSSATVDVDLTPYLLKATFDDLFEKVNIGSDSNPQWTIKAKYGLWTEQFLSAKGVGSDTSAGGGGGIDYEALEEYLRDNLAGYLSQYAKISDIPDVSGFLTDYDVKSISVNGGAQQPLKGSGNVDINAATSIGGSGHITAGSLQADGTIEVGVESGYSIPSNSKQQGWDAAKALLEELFEKVNLGTDSNPQWTIKAKYGLWTEGFLSAKGVGDGSAEGISYEAVQEMIADALAGYTPAATDVNWADITGKPDVFAPSAHQHTVADITDLTTTLSGYSTTGHEHTKAEITDFAHMHSWNDITSDKPTTLGGYGITDAVPNTRKVSAGTGLTGGGALDADRTISLNATNVGLLQMLADMFEWATVAGVQTIKAKASLWTDGYLSAKGTSSDSSASGLTAEAVQEMIDDALVGYTPGDGVVEWTDIVGKPDVFAPSSHAHTWDSITGKPSTFTPANHSHTKADITDFTHSHTKDDITDFAHSHAIDDVTGLQTALDGKVPTSRTITAGTGLAGGGDLTADRTIKLSDKNVALLAMLDSMFEKVAVNGVDTIKAKMSLWTDGYLSAKGTSNDSSASGLTAEAVQEMIDDALVGYTPGDGIVEWTDIVGKPDVFNPASHTHSYLPLSGGTLTGNLTIGTNPIVGVGDAYMLAHKPTGGMTGVSTTQWGVGALTEQGVIRSNDTDLVHYRNGNATPARVILDSYNYSSYALPLTGGTLTGLLYGSGYTIKMDVDTSRTRDYNWHNVAGDTIASVMYHNTAQNIIINPCSNETSDVWDDAVGKYSLFVGKNRLTYNTYPILHSNNYSSYALPLSGGTLTGSLTMNSNVVIGNSGVFMLGHKPTEATTGVSATQWFVGASDSQGVIRSTNTNLIHYRNGASSPSSVILDSANYTDYAVPNTRKVSAGTGLTGGGTLAADRTISLNATNVGLLQMLSDMFEWQTVGGVRTIKAKASLWTEGYLSAKGTSNDSSASGLTAEAVQEMIDDALVGYTPGDGIVEWTDIVGKPDTFAPSSHTHSYLPLTGGTLTGSLLATGFGIKFDTDTSRALSFYWSNAANTATTAQVMYHNMAQNIIINPCSNETTEIWNDAVGKYSLFVGKGRLTYNTYPILHSNNFSSYALPLSGGTLSGLLTANGGLKVSGRVYGTGDDEGIVITPADNGWCSLALGSNTGRRSTISLNYSDTTKKPFWRYHDGTNDYIAYHPGKAGTLAVTSDLSAYLPLTGGTLTGSLLATGFGIKFDTDLSRVYGIDFKNTSSATTAHIGYHNTAQNIIINPCSNETTEIWNDAVGKYSLVVGKGRLTYNGYTLLRSDNYSSYALPLSGGTLTGNLTIGSNVIIGGDGQYMLGHKPTVATTGVSATQWFVGASDSQGVIRSNNTDLVHYRHGASTTATTILDSANYSAYITKSYVDGLGVNAATAEKLVTARNIWGQSFNGTANVDGVFRSLTAAPDGQVLHSILKNPTSPYGLLTRIYDSGMASLQSQRETTTSEYFGLSLNPLGGNVGIGTTSPEYKLDVNGGIRSNSTCYINSPSGTDGMIYCQLNGGTQIGFGVGTSTKRGIYDTSKGWLIYTDGTSTILPTLNVGIGTTSPDAKLHVAGAVHATDNITSDKECVSKFTSSSSDERLKRVTGGVDIALRSIASAPSIRFDWRDGSGKDAGSIAQYWQDIVPEAVRTDSKGYLTMQYGKLALLSAISLARNAVSHEARIAQLEGEVERLKQEVERLSA